MPWRLIVFIVIFAVFLVFITFNLENKCDISFGFKVIPDVPVFVTVFSSFVLGIFCALPLILHIKKGFREKHSPDAKPGKTEAPAPSFGESDSGEKIKQDAASARERFFSKRNKNG